MSKRSDERLRGIVRDEIRKEREYLEWRKRHDAIPEEVRGVWQRLEYCSVPTDPLGRPDLLAVVEDVLDTYWEVVEEDMNRDR